MKNVIITGATGAIGIALINKLKMEGIHVFVVCRPGSLRNSRIAEGKFVTKVFCDISDISRLPTLVHTPCDVIFHLAWIGTDTPENRVNLDLQIKNIEYTVNVVNAASVLGCKVFVGAGSQAEFGDVKGIINTDTPEVPASAYGMAKFCTKRITYLLCKDLGMKHIWPHILSIYGPYMRENTLLSTVIEKVSANEVPLLTKCEQIWDYLCAADAADALYLLALHGKSGGKYILGSGNAKKLRFYAETIRNIINPCCDIGFGKIPYRPDQVMHLEADISSLSKDTGWRPKITFEQGVRLMLDFRNREKTFDEKVVCH